MAHGLSFRLLDGHTSDFPIDNNHKPRIP